MRKNTKSIKEDGRQHGELFIQAVDKLPKGEYRAVKQLVAAHSETGHHHVLESTAEFEVMGEVDKTDLYLRLFEPAKLVHKKTANRHKTLNLKAGLYKVWHKTEYNPFAGLIQKVRD